MRRTADFMIANQDAVRSGSCPARLAAAPTSSMNITSASPLNCIADLRGQVMGAFEEGLFVGEPHHWCRFGGVHQIVDHGERGSGFPGADRPAEHHGR